MKLNHFKDKDFLPAIKALFKELNVPMNYVADEPTTAKEILKDTYKDNDTFQLVDDVYFVGMVDDAAFEGNQSLETEKIKSDYDGILIFGVTLNQRSNNLLPTRSQLAEISRAFNREFYYTPVVLVFKYRDNQKKYFAFANTERLKYKQEWREGEKAGKVSLLRDINIDNPHQGHVRILFGDKVNNGLKINPKIDSFAKLYAYWQEVFNVSILNKKFYQELSHWYFWAINHVKFPSEPTIEDAYRKDAKLEELIKEHNATNVIRLLTRLLFTWFIKEKKLVPEELFDLDALQKDILKEISPYHENGMFKDANKESVYYKAILQNLFFASLNCPIEADETDSRVRQFRGDESYGKHRGIDWMMRYKKYFKNPDTFLQLMNKTVPFLNGGLFECLDDKTQNLYIDGFSDQMTKGEQLIVPDYLFFGATEYVDLSPEYGVKNKGTKQAAVKGLMNILHSYKFTVTENTPVEEDVALDPELLGKVFENLLASYNPETKTTARKQTGSFYTPREIVNYMVDESLIAYLKNALTDWELSDAALDKKLHELSSFDPVNPFAEDERRTKRIVKAIDECKILDPACGSGAFPMGILQKIVHMLQKLDPENTIWKDVQKNKAKQAADTAYEIEDTGERRERLREIDEAFDRSINDPDYARKLYLIENCIYGVDIQPIATQISKLRFFISLVVDQRKNEDKPNFGIRALPNLETKFVAANTLIGIEKPQAQTSLFDTPKVKELEAQLKKIRSKLFSAKTKETKLKYRKQDEELRNAIATELKSSGWPNDTAEKLAAWDPYDQNASSTFFDPEWMFDVKEGFNVVIGNPPYKVLSSKDELLSYFRENYKVTKGGKVNLYKLFIEKSIHLLNKTGVLSFITPYNYLTSGDSYELRKLIINKTQIIEIIDYEEDQRVFENVTQAVATIVLQNGFNEDSSYNYFKNREQYHISVEKVKSNKKLLLKGTTETISRILQYSDAIGDKILGFQGEINVSTKKELFTQSKSEDNLPLIRGNHIGLYELLESPSEYCSFSLSNREHHFIDRIIFQEVSNAGLKKRVKGVLLNRVLCGHTTNYVIPKEIKQKWFFLGLINSSLINYYFKFFNQTNHVPIGEIKDIPIPPLKHETLISIVGILSKMINKNFNQVIFMIIDALIYYLYFPDHMKEREIDVLEFVERDIEQALQGREFDSLDDGEKEKVIEQLHAIWSDPENEVVKRMAQFKEKSPEILKPILEN